MCTSPRIEYKVHLQALRPPSSRHYPWRIFRCVQVAPFPNARVLRQAIRRSRVCKRGRVRNGESFRNLLSDGTLPRTHYLIFGTTDKSLYVSLLLFFAKPEHLIYISSRILTQDTPKHRPGGATKLSICSVLIAKYWATNWIKGGYEMGLADWFRTFCTNIQVQDGGTISNRYKTITHRLNADFWNTESYTSHSLYVGSYGRKTAIQGFSDLDMIFRLPSNLYKQYDSHSGNGQSALLQTVRKSLRKTYSTTSIGADGQVIKIRFKDRITFEIVPAFVNKGGSFTFPNANDGGSWRTTNPKPEIEAIRARNRVCNNNLVPLCRMMRAWKSKWQVPIGGLLIDTLAYQFIDTWKYKSKSYFCYDYMCRDFFLFMADQDKEKAYWKAPGSGQYVFRKGLFQWKAKRCYNIALEAIKHETAEPKRTWSAKQEWRKIFGSTFPG